MSAKSTRQIQCRAYRAYLRERWIHKPLVSRYEERIRLRERRKALLVLDIPTGSLIFTAIFAAHADRLLAECGLLLQFRVFGFGFVEEREVGVGIFPGGEEILVSDAGFRNIALFLKQPAQLQLCGDE